MDGNQNNFEVNYKEQLIRVQRHYLGNKEIIYRIIFSQQTPPLVITRASRSDGSKHWTSIPEGRVKEAQEIGPLIENFYKQ